MCTPVHYQTDTAGSKTSKTRLNGATQAQQKTGRSAAHLQQEAARLAG